MRLSALVEEFLGDCRTRRLSGKTISWYDANLRYFLDWLRDNGLPDDLASFTLANARRYGLQLSERTASRGTFVSAGGCRGVHALVATDRPLSAETVSGYLRTLKRFSRWLAEEAQDYTARNTLAGLRLPRKPQTRKEPLRDAEKGALLACYNLRRPIANRDFTILLTYLGTGLRATELVDLRLDDVHLDEGYLRVRSGKGRKSRVVNIPPEVGQAIRRYLLHFRPQSGADRLFLARGGTALTYNAIKLVMRRARQKSGNTRLHAHLLRHSFSVSALSGGMDLNTLKETLGHSDIRTTSGYLAMSEQQLVAQQRKVNPISGIALPGSVRGRGHS